MFPSTTAPRCGPGCREMRSNLMSECCRLPTLKAKALEPKDVTTAPVYGAAGRRVGDAVFIPGGRSFVGTNTPIIPQDGEGPERSVLLADYLLAPTTVTNAQFAVFVAETGYVTEAEQIGWSAVFDGAGRPAFAVGEAGNALPWWHVVNGASWKCPEGPDSAIADRMDHPVVQVSWKDANAYAHWAGGRLPSEAEWEHGARGGATRQRFPWGEQEPGDETILCNIWQGHFPSDNTLRDGYLRTAPARSFPPNALGLHNMAGNVWEWSADAFRIRSMGVTAQRRNAVALKHAEKVLKGGSFLCHISYCYRYRVAARIGMSPDSASSNVGFRLAFDPLEGGIMG